MIENLQDTFMLNNGIAMPGFGLGVFKIGDGSPVINSVKSALRYGYRLIDTASIYGNERGVGTAIKESGLEREDVFLTTKVWNSDQKEGTILKAFESSLEKLQTDYVDLYLIHWPVKSKIVESWKVLERLYNEKRVRSIGVSNFTIDNLKTLLNESEIVPAVNQVEIHPLLTQEKLREFCNLNNIVVQGWSPLMQGNLDISLLDELSKKYKKNNGQIVLRWHIQNEIIPIPKSIHDYRIRDNKDIFDFTLSSDEMQRLNNLNQNRRFGPDPDTFDP